MSGDPRPRPQDHAGRQRLQADTRRSDRLKLVDLVNRSAEIFRTTKDIKTAYGPCPSQRNIEVIYPGI